MTRLKWLVIGVFTVFVLGVSAPASAETDAERAAKQTEAMQLTNMKITYNKSWSALKDVLLAVQEYSTERRNKDEVGMRTAAAALLTSLSEARFWYVRLDAEVTESLFSPKIDKDVAELTALVTSAYDEISDELLSNDLKAINKAMDDSGNAFSILARTNQNVMVSLWPKLGAQ